MRCISFSRGEKGTVCCMAVKKTSCLGRSDTVCITSRWCVSYEGVLDSVFVFFNNAPLIVLLWGFFCVSFLIMG